MKAYSINSFVGEEQSSLFYSTELLLFWCSFMILLLSVVHSFLLLISHFLGIAQFINQKLTFRPFVSITNISAMNKCIILWDIYIYISFFFFLCKCLGSEWLVRCLVYALLLKKNNLANFFQGG